MSLLNYWPSLNEINKCIKSEAENASDEVLLAVHQQFPLAHLTVGADGRVMPESRTVATEEDLLNYFIGDAPSGSHVLPITGASGVGKSHLIRMIDARLHRLQDANRYLVIRIPKSASLRRVVELILEAEPLKDSKYDHVKAEFTKALADIRLDEAVIRFQAQLEIALNEEALRLKQSLAQDPTNVSVKERLAHARDLPKLMSDAETVMHFRLNVLPRIIQRSVEGVESEGEEKEIDSTTAQFRVDDLNLGSLDIGRANTQVANYYRLNLDAREGRGKAIAISVLNDVVDIATRQLYQLNQSFGGKTLAEVILEIRRLLLVDNRELVILVEDFAALVGIQDTLAKVLIQEGETSKGKEFATIRSAIAVTDGYLAGRDTLATRAGKEWVVESRLESEDETLRRTKSLVASYLNAARFGEAGLKKHYQQAAMEAGSSDTRWLPPVYSEDGEEDGEILRAFGYEGKVPLFPFTEAAIECLARATLTTGNVLVFSPRFVIKNIIREILMAGREAFAHKQFPPPGITTKKPSADVAQWLASLHVSDDQRKRYERLVTVWGNDPQTRSDIGCIPREVFEVFGLPQPEIEYIPPKPKQDSSAVKPTDIAPPEIASRQEQQIKGCQTALESWVQNGTKLEQSIANEIRKALETLMNQRIDWNAERCLKREFFRTQFSIPNAGGEGNLASDVIKIAPSSDDPDGRLRGELIALLRYFWVYKDAPDYEGVDDDLARIANLVDRLLPDALEIVRVTVKKQNQSAILALAANSRLLGINERGRTVGAISSFLFGDVGVIEALPDTAPQTFKDWRDLQSSAVQIRSQLRQLLLDTSGCFQGTTGKTAYGIDIVRLMENYPDDKATIEFASLAGLAPELRQSLQNMSDVKVSARLNQVLQDTRKIQKLITEDLGVDIDKQVVADIFKELTATLREMGAWSPSEIGISVNEFTALCEAFRTAAIKESLSILQGFDSGGEDQTSAKKVTLGAQLPLFPLLTTERFLNFANKVIRAADAHAQALESQYDGISPSEKAQEIQCAFNELIENLVTLQIGEV